MAAGSFWRGRLLCQREIVSDGIIGESDAGSAPFLHDLSRNESGVLVHNHLGETQLWREGRPRIRPKGRVAVGRTNLGWQRDALSIDFIMDASMF